MIYWRGREWASLGKLCNFSETQISQHTGSALAILNYLRFLKRATYVKYLFFRGASPVAEWLSLGLHLGGPRFRRFRSWAQTWHRSSGHAEAASHMPRLEGATTKIYNYVLGAFGEKKQEKKKEDWQLLLAQVPIFKTMYIYFFFQPPHLLPGTR